MNLTQKNRRIFGEDHDDPGYQSRSGIISWLMVNVHAHRPARLQAIARKDLESLPDHELFRLYAYWQGELS